MPTPDQIEDVLIRLEAVVGERFAPDGEWMRPSDAPDAVPFDALTFDQKAGVLTSELKWLGFDAAQIEDVSRRVIAGEEPYEWMNGLPEGDRQEWARASAREYREELFAAHHDRLPTPEDLAGEDAAIRSLDWSGAEANLPPGPPPVTDAELEQILAGVDRQWPANDNEPDPRFVRADGTVSNRTTSEFVEWEISTIRGRYSNEDDHPPRDEWHLVPEREKYRLIQEGSSIDELTPEEAMAVLGRHVDLERLGLEREDILADAFMLNRELGFIGFRNEYFNDPDALKDWPDPVQRELGLREAWDSVADFDTYRAGLAEVPTEDLEHYRESLGSRLTRELGDKAGNLPAATEASRAEFDRRLDEAAAQGMSRVREKGIDRGMDR